MHHFDQKDIRAAIAIEPGFIFTDNEKLEGRKFVHFSQPSKDISDRNKSDHNEP